MTDPALTAQQLQDELTVRDLTPAGEALLTALADFRDDVSSDEARWVYQKHDTLHPDYPDVDVRLTRNRTYADVHLIPCGSTLAQSRFEGDGTKLEEDRVLRLDAESCYALSEIFDEVGQALDLEGKVRAAQEGAEEIPF